MAASSRQVRVVLFSLIALWTVSFQTTMDARFAQKLGVKRGVVEKTWVVQNVQTLVRWTVVACRDALYLIVFFLRSIPGEGAA